MRSELITKLNITFEESAYEEDGIEYWFARDLQKLLEYSEWRNYHTVINKAKTACEKSKHLFRNQFVDVNKMVSLESGSYFGKQNDVDKCFIEPFSRPPTESAGKT